MPTSEASAPAMSSAAVTSTVLCRAGVVTADPVIRPAKAMATRPAMRATALLTAEPMPASSAGTAPRIAAVSGATPRTKNPSDIAP
jgi:hypothetical protein